MPLSPPPRSNPLLTAPLLLGALFALPACGDKDDSESSADDSELIAPTCGPCCHGDTDACDSGDSTP